MLLCLEILCFTLHLHPPRRCVLVRDWLQILHSIGPEFCVLLQRYTCVPHATSYESLRHLCGAHEYSCMKSVPVALAACSSVQKTPLIAVLCDVSYIAFLMSVLRLVISRLVSGLFGVVCLICGHVRRPPIGGGGGVCLVKCDVWWDLFIHYRSCCRVGRFIVIDVRG